MKNKLVKNTFTTIRFEEYEIESAKPILIDGNEVTIGKSKRKIIKAKGTLFSKHKIEIEPLALALLKIDLNDDDEDIAYKFTKNWGFLDFTQKFNEAKGIPYGQSQTFFEEGDEEKFIKNYFEPTRLWKDLSFYLHYLFYLNKYSLSQINNIFLKNDELPNRLISNDSINFELHNRVSPALGFKRNKLDSIYLETYSLYGAVLMFAIDNFYREIRQCDGPTCRQMFFVKRKGRKFCEPNGKCAKAYERLNKKK